MVALTFTGLELQPTAALSGKTKERDVQYSPVHGDHADNEYQGPPNQDINEDHQQYFGLPHYNNPAHKEVG